jgi:hypothetical protein
MFYRGELLKRIPIAGDECVEIMRRLDGMYQFIHRKPCNNDHSLSVPWESSPYISAETAEAAARLKFNLSL